MKFCRYLNAICCAVLLGLSSQFALADIPVSSKHVIQWQEVVQVGYRKPIDASVAVPKMIVVNKLASYWVKQPHGFGRVRITVPVRYYLTSWDVQALERELERLGVKVKPRPIPTKPGPVSG